MELHQKLYTLILKKNADSNQIGFTEITMFLGEIEIKSTTSEGLPKSPEKAVARELQASCAGRSSET